MEDVSNERVYCLDVLSNYCYQERVPFELLYPKYVLLNEYSKDVLC